MFNCLSVTDRNSIPMTKRRELFSPTFLELYICLFATVPVACKAIERNVIVDFTKPYHRYPSFSTISKWKKEAGVLLLSGLLV